MAIHGNRETMSPGLSRISGLAKEDPPGPGPARGVMLEEPAAGNLHGGVCGGRAG